MISQQLEPLVDIYVLNVNNRARCEICSKLTTTHQIEVFISHLILVFLLLTLSSQKPIGWRDWPSSSEENLGLL